MIVKRLFDLFFSFSALLLFGWIILLSYFIASFDTHTSGFFLQKRIGRYGLHFTIIKIRTMSQSPNGIVSISKIGSFLRRSKIDELPQLINVLVGSMSIVGPRPDIPGYYDVLQGEKRKLLDLKPGLTGPASLKYYNEEVLLASVENSKIYNDEVIFPDKVRINLNYYYNRSFWVDLKIVWKTIFRF